MHNYNNLQIWQEAMDIVELIYRTTNHFPAEEKYGLCSQMNRAAVSIPSNIAEGAGRNTDKEFIYFLYVAKASSAEIRSQLYLAFDLEYISNEEFENLYIKITDISKLISGLIKYLNKS